MRRVSWVSDSGHILVFDGKGPYFLTGLSDSLGATAETVKAPRQDGTTTYHTALDTRSIVLSGSMQIFGDRLHPAQAAYDRARAALHAAFAPNGWGVLTYYKEDEAVQIRCRPVATPSISSPTATYSTVDIDFTTDASYWEQAKETVEIVGVILRLWRFPWAPVRGPIGAFNPFAVTPNPSDVDVYPTVEVFSTGQLVTVENMTTGEFVTIEHPIALGQKLTIDMRDVSAYLWEQDEAGVYRRGEDVSHWMSLNSTPWVLKPGGNRLAIRNEKPEDTPVAYIRYRIPSLGV